MTTPFHTRLQAPSGRRAFLGAIAALASAPLALPAASVATIPPQKQDFVDPVTEFPVTRWTEESADARVPQDPLRALTRDDDHILYASNRSGSWQPYLLNLPKGDSVQVAQARDMHPGSLALFRDDKDALFLDGDSLVRTQLRKGRTRELYRASDGWQPTGDLRFSLDDRTAAITESRGAATRILFVNASSGDARPVLQAESAQLRMLDFHPRYGLLVLDSQGKPAFAGSQQSPNFPPFPDGEILHAQWDSSGERMIYLLHSKGEQERFPLMELDLATGKHRIIGNTSKFATFFPNRDASVFVGASSSIAQPFLLLLLRVTRREFPLMEHRAKQPAMVRPFFSNDSQTIYFQSDRLGKACLFSLSVKGLVEKT